MDTLPDLLFHQRDLRSSAIPRLRESSKRAKYGGAPPIDAFEIQPTNSAALPDVIIGKPRTDLTPTEQYQVAQRSVGPLIGKRVNRHNQRTGERDPWRYWGAGRKWGIREARGKDVDAYIARRILAEEDWLREIAKLENGTGTCSICAPSPHGVHNGPPDLLWTDEQMADIGQRLGLKKKSWGAYRSLHQGHGSDAGIRAEKGIDPSKPMNIVMALRSEMQEGLFTVRSGRESRTKRRTSRDSWELVIVPSASRSRPSGDEDWELLSIPSEPD
ncbi:MAG: hypothetical protein OHK93_003811 [Ramalina farinacea]|uniref:Uncharacterized protein n=1 Tax=Ramalina farinacea TaxID=258253 RepID=A0AA43QFI9_9LECA|nr:hypothetical protein [Ramalina farinacea]